ncbi:acyl-CoA thioesterase [Pseudomonas sp.]|uniref:acyl-CoA thioesterase n=1 Tax=Pseudomonas sp. TaxID=306 RepID=UPI00272BBD84|nr:thioesterase family protein [Pseudomonas sp.]
MPGNALADRAFTCRITPRYTDLDTWRHVNNTRLYEMHLEARLLAHLQQFGPDAWFSDGVRLRPLRAITSYRQVTWFARDVEARVRVVDVSADGYRVFSELFQDGQLVGTQDCLMGAFQRGRPVAMPAETLAVLQEWVCPNDDLGPMPEADYRNSFEHIPMLAVHQQITARYGDLDADSQRSEAALARYMEQARFGGIRQLDMGGLGILIAQADISFANYLPGWQPLELASGISRIGNSSFVFDGCALHKGELQACAKSVMVVIDPASNRPAPIPAPLREQLERWLIRPA